MRILIVLACAFLVVACSSDKPEKTEATVGKEIADDYNRQLDKARAVEDQVMEQKRQIDEALKQAEDN